MSLPETNQRCELIAGELIREPGPSADHQTISMNLTLCLGRFIKTGNLGRLLACPMDVVLGGDVVQPDLLFIAKERLSIVQKKGGIDGAPDLVVEILSPATAKKDRTWKRGLYARHGVREYWIVDPVEREVEVLKLSGGEYRVFSRLTRDGKLTSSVLPGFELRCTELFGYGD